ncbi:magnesium chelatase, partial [Mesorhizobium sp. M00.F.Ca.ET.186.01.1.1]
MKAIKVLIAALGLMVILHACSSDEPSSTQEPTTPPEAVSNEQVEQAVNQEQKPSKEEQIASLKALLPEGAT